MEWYWWLLIILVVLVALWLLMRARQGSSAARPGDAELDTPRAAAATGDWSSDESGLGGEARGFASTAGLVEPEEAPAADSGPYGAGSAQPTADGSAPAGYSIKGNIESMLYHTPGGHSYDLTHAEVWFRTAAEAEAAGFSAAHADSGDD